MKLNLKAIVATAAFAVSGFVNAAIQTNIEDQSLVLSIYHAASDTSFVQDLGVTYSEIVAGGPGSYSATFDLDALALTAAFGSVADRSTLQWSVYTSGQNFLLPGDQYGFVASFQQAPSPQDYVNISNTSLAHETFGLAVNYSGGMISLPTGSAVWGATGSAVSAATAIFQNGLGGFVPTAAFDSVNDSMYLYWAHLNNDWEPAPVDVLSATAFTINLSDFDNAYLSGVAPVPLPAAFWLFASALLGLGSVARRRAAK